MKFKLLDINNIMHPFLLIVFSLLISCNSSSQETIKTNDINSANLLNPKLSGYMLGSGDFDRIPDHPYQEYFQCDSLGYYVIHYIAKKKKLRDFWSNKNIFEYNDSENQNKLISKILKPQINQYHQFLCYIPMSSLDSIYGCTLESIQIKPEGEVLIYIKKNNLWEKIWTEKEADLPKYYSTQYFVDQFPEYFKND